MSLKLRFTLFSIILILLSSFAAWTTVSALIEDVIEEWAVRYAEKQVLYDRQRTLQPLIRELALSRQFAQSTALINFARNPEDPELRQRALKEMESFRYNFLEMNYFVALRNSGEYFHNDANNTYQNSQLRYVLSPDNPTDRWFYTLIDQKREINVNVNMDAELEVTKVWLNILLTDGPEVLGVVGTGLNLNTVLNRVTQETDPGVTNIFVDHTGAIQLHHDTNLVNFSSFTRPTEQQHNVQHLIDQETDKTQLRHAMHQAYLQKDKVISNYISINNRRTLMAVAYLPEIDWYEVTLIDLDTLLPMDRFSGMFMVYGVTLVAMILILNLAIRYMVLRPVNHLKESMEILSQGKTPDHQLQGQAEIGGLMQHFNHLVSAVGQNRANIEHRLELCQQELERTKRVDSLTGLLNRRGMLSLLEEQYRNQPDDSGLCFSLIWLDIDFMKEINDRYGQSFGDKALQTVTEIMTKHIDDAVLGTSSRWGGDELLALVNHTQAYQILAIAEAIRLEVERCRPAHSEQSHHPIPLTVSLGAYVVKKNDSLNEALQHADNALLRAKAEGRNLVRLSNESSLSLKSSGERIIPS